MLHTRQFTVAGEHGLHVRPAAELARLAGTFQADISLVGNGLTADARSVFSLLCLGATQGTELTVTVTGTDAPAAWIALDQIGWLAGRPAGRSAAFIAPESPRPGACNAG